MHRPGDAVSAGRTLLTLLAVFGLLWATGCTHDGTPSGHPRPDAYEQVWTVKSHTYTERGQVEPEAPLATYVVGDAVVLVDRFTIAGYGLTDGKQRWRVTLPNRQGICALARSGDLLGYVVGSAVDEDEHGGCASVRSLDMRSGRRLWQRTLARADRAATHDDTAIDAVAGRFVVSGWNMVTYDARTGRSAWAYRSKKCKTHDVIASREVLVGRYWCDAGRSKPVHEVLISVDPDTGKPRWRRTLSTVGDRDYTFVAGTPLVVAVEDYDENQGAESAYLVFDEHGRQTARFDADMELRQPVYVHDGVLEGMQDMHGKGGNRSVVAVDLADGAEKWEKRLPCDEDDSALDSSTGNTVVCSGGPGPGFLVSVDTRTGKAVKGATIGADGFSVYDKRYLTGRRTVIEESLNPDDGESVLTVYALR